MYVVRFMKEGQAKMAKWQKDWADRTEKVKKECLLLEEEDDKTIRWLETAGYFRALERRKEKAERDEERRRARQANDQMTATFFIRKAELEKASRRYNESCWIEQLKNGKQSSFVQEGSRANPASARLQIDSENPTSLGRLALPGKRYSTRLINANGVL